MSEIKALKTALQAVRDRLKTALKAEKPPWTAISSLTRQETELALKIAALEAHSAEEGEVTADEIVAGIMALPDDLVEVAQHALDDRRAAGGPVAS